MNTPVHIWLVHILLCLFVSNSNEVQMPKKRKKKLDTFFFYVYLQLQGLKFLNFKKKIFSV